MSCHLNGTTINGTMVLLLIEQCTTINRTIVLLLIEQWYNGTSNR